MVCCMCLYSLCNSYSCIFELFWSRCCVFYFFFFKQKTAYEMRISDWSSDVCSSDLLSGANNPSKRIDEYRAIAFHLREEFLERSVLGPVASDIGVEILFDKEVGSAGIARLAFRKIAAPEPEPAVIVGKMPEHHLRDEMMPLRFRRFARHIHRITISRSRAQAASLDRQSTRL